ncbi:diguanylate cyclase (GGDEF)-like protein [Acidovorax temperans]|uniref:diguanylate cyclase n=1 Tax=Acidovorax temperans TaxID=80878 RepID=A0A543L6U3_9BURK|nr:diguanylate cyclase (GGDEF)-like protein [Acidovorax temperans]
MRRALRHGVRPCTTTAGGDHLHLSAYWRRWTDWVLTTDKRQRIRLAMAGLAALLMVCCLVVMSAVAAAGLASTAEVRVWTACSVLGLIAVYAAIRSGWSRRFKDPALTLAQILYAITCCAAAFVIAGPARGVTLPILAIILMFGIFGLTTRQMLGVLVYSLVAFGVASGVVAARDEPDYPTVVAAAYVGMVVVVLLSSTFLTTRVQSTREHLRRQKAELAQALEQIRQLATHDDLTGLLNRRAMLDRMQLEQRRSLRSGSPLLIAQLDIDHFKVVNDTHGHAAGDLVLQSFADTVRRNVRDTDVLARWGGEEFVLLLCDTPAADAVALMERLRQAVQAMQVPVAQGGQPITVTVSIGLARHTPADPLAGTLERADRALYAAKAGGRNRVVPAPCLR